MSIISTKFIEYRTEDGNWHLLDAYAPVSGDSEKGLDYNNCVKGPDGREICRVKSLDARIGHWLDFLYTGKGESTLENRGFPKDMSEELKSILDEQADNPYILCKSWFTLEELWHKYECDREKFKKDFENIYNKFLLSVTNANISRIQESVLALKNNTEMPKIGVDEVDVAELQKTLKDFFTFDYERQAFELALYFETMDLATFLKKNVGERDIRIVYYVSK